jgi:hypothetical protein
MKLSEIEKILGYQIDKHEVIKITKRNGRIYVKTDRETILADETSFYAESPFFDFCLEPRSDNRQPERKVS